MKLKQNEIFQLAKRQAAFGHSHLLSMHVRVIVSTNLFDHTDCFPRNSCLQVQVGVCTVAGNDNSKSES
jgi:hypothetical protein